MKKAAIIEIKEMACYIKEKALRLTPGNVSHDKNVILYALDGILKTINRSLKGQK